MDNLTRRINDYLANRREFRKQEEDLFEVMKKSFAEEVPAIQAKMPGGYSLENPEICVDGITGTPSISLSFSKCLLASSKSSGMMLEEDYSRLNQLFQEDFQRIKRERGYEVRFVMVWRLG